MSSPTTAWNTSGHTRSLTSVVCAKATTRTSEAQLVRIKHAALYSAVVLKACVCCVCCVCARTVYLCDAACMLPLLPTVYCAVRTRIIYFCSVQLSSVQYSKFSSFHSVKFTHCICLCLCLCLSRQYPPALSTCLPVAVLTTEVLDIASETVVVGGDMDTA